MQKSVTFVRRCLEPGFKKPKTTTKLFQIEHNSSWLHFTTSNDLTPQFFVFVEGYPEKQEEETLEKWRERCREKEKSVVLNAGKLLMDSNQDNFETVNIVLTGRVPTIKFLHKKTGIKCDLTFKVRDVT